MTDALLTFCGAEGFRPVIVTGFKFHSNLIQVAKASLTLIGTEEGEILLALGLREWVEDVMDLQGEMIGSEDSAAGQTPKSGPVAHWRPWCGNSGFPLTLIQTLVTSS